jgi:cytochrome c peroxidase
VGLPAELTRRAIPPDNRQTPEKIALGEKLFFDGRLLRHNVVALARQAEQLINHAEAVDRAAVGTDFSALGRFLITKKKADIAAFKTPDIRNLLVTGPYFHDGSQETLWDVIDHYNQGRWTAKPLSRRRYPTPRLD